MITAEKYLSEGQITNDFYEHRPRVNTSQTITPTGLEEENLIAIFWSRQQLKPLLQFTANWDGYNADAPTEDAMQTAVNILANLRVAYQVEAPYVSPTRSGSVSMEWENKDHYLEIDIESAEGGTYFYKNMKTSDVLKGHISADQAPDFPFRRTLELLFRRKS